MFKKFFLFCLLNSLFSSLYALNAAQNFSKLLASYSTFSASFTQETLSHSGKVIAHGTGKFWLQRPDYFRWVSSSPNKQIIVGDGQSLWMYDVDLLQATKQPWNDSLKSPVQLLLSNVTDITNQYQITETVPSHDMTEYVVIPKTLHSNFTKLIFRFRKNLLISMQLDNTLGQQSFFKYTNSQINSVLSPSLFQMHLPKGTDIIDNTHTKDVV